MNSCSNQRGTLPLPLYLGSLMEWIDRCKCIHKMEFYYKNNLFQLNRIKINSHEIEERAEIQGNVVLPHQTFPCKIEF